MCYSDIISLIKEDKNGEVKYKNVNNLYFRFEVIAAFFIFSLLISYNEGASSFWWILEIDFVALFFVLLSMYHRIEKNKKLKNKYPHAFAKKAYCSGVKLKSDGEPPIADIYYFAEWDELTYSCIEELESYKIDSSYPLSPLSYNKYFGRSTEYSHKHKKTSGLIINIANWCGAISVIFIVGFSIEAWIESGNTLVGAGFLGGLMLLLFLMRFILHTAIVAFVRVRFRDNPTIMSSIATMEGIKPERIWEDNGLSVKEWLYLFFIDKRLLKAPIVIIRPFKEKLVSLLEKCPNGIQMFLNLSENCQHKNTLVQAIGEHSMNGFETNRLLCNLLDPKSFDVMLQILNHENDVIGFEKKISELHPELKKSIKYDFISYTKYCKSNLKWYKYGKAIVEQNENFQWCVTIYDILYKPVYQTGFQSIDSYRIPIFDTGLLKNKDILVNLKDSEIIIVFTEDGKRHLYINPKYFSKEQTDALLKYEEIYAKEAKESFPYDVEIHKANDIINQSDKCLLERINGVWGIKCIKGSFIKFIPLLNNLTIDSLPSEKWELANKQANVLIYHLGAFRKNPKCISRSHNPFADTTQPTYIWEETTKTYIDSHIIFNSNLNLDFTVVQLVSVSDGKETTIKIMDDCYSTKGVVVKTIELYSFDGEFAPLYNYYLGKYLELARKVQKSLNNEDLTRRENTVNDDNKEQQTVIELCDGCHLVLAPPGCGKTRVLAERVVNAVSNGVNVEDMLCLTFTNRAAREMRDRISSRAEQEVLDNLFVGNVHHFCSYMLREYKVISQLTTIIDDEESTAILQNIVRQVTGKEKKDVDSYYNYQHYLYQIEHKHPEELIVRSECGDKLLDFDYKKVVREYVSYKEKYGLLDFEDLLLKGYDFIRDHKDEIKKYSWIQIDEVQDLNSLQLAIIDLVATDDACIVYLGDEQQAIYGFNGVKLATLKSLKDRCAGHIHHFLGNYRSPQYLLNILNQYAEYNLHVSRELLPIAKGKDAQNTKEDGCLILETCDQKEGMDLSDYCSYDMACDRAVSYQDGRTAILANSNREVDIISERLYRRGVEHFKISGSDFMWTKEVKLILSHFNIFIHPENIMSWARILMGFKVMPTLEKAHAFLLEANDSYLYTNDLLSDKRRSLIKEFLRYYPDEFVIFDTETTGLDVNNDDIVEIAAIRIKEGCIIDELDIMLETTKSIPLELNGEPNPLNEEYPKRKKIGRRVGLNDFMSWVGNVPVLAHNARFDFLILDANLKRDCNTDDLSSRWPIVLDSLKIARAVEPGQKSYRLKDLLAAFNLAGKNSHLAIDDVKATKSLVDYCYKKASPIFVKQNEFFAENRDVIEMLRKQYSNLYSHTKALLSKKESERNVFVGEIVYVYDCLVNDEIIGKMEKMKYLTEFLERDFLQETSELTLRQILDKYMMELNTLREADLCDSKSLREKVGLFVSTVHRAKGLEFDNVVVTGVVDGIYPFWEATKILKESFIPKEREKARRDIEESARKLYVALSRAKKRLCIQYPRNNTGFGKFGWFQHIAKPSPFINCISQMFDIVMN